MVIREADFSLLDSARRPRINRQQRAVVLLRHGESCDLQERDHRVRDNYDAEYYAPENYGREWRRR